MCDTRAPTAPPGRRRPLHITRQDLCDLSGQLSGQRGQAESGLIKCGSGVVGKLPTRRRDEAVQLANVVDFGLGGVVWSTSQERAIRVAEQLEVGMANINTPAGEGADLLFGGTKRSGFGRELGPRH